MTEIQELLADYVQTGSEPAFRGLLVRYVDLVYSAAVRLVGGDRHLAEYVAQIVFAMATPIAHPPPLRESSLRGGSSASRLVRRLRRVVYNEVVD